MHNVISLPKIVELWLKGFRPRPLIFLKYFARPFTRALANEIWGTPASPPQAARRRQLLQVEKGGPPMAPRARAIKIKAAGRGHLTGGKYWKFKEYRARMIALNPVDVNSDDGNRVSNKH